MIPTLAFNNRHDDCPSLDALFFLSYFTIIRYYLTQYRKNEKEPP